MFMERELIMRWFDVQNYWMFILTPAILTMIGVLWYFWDDLVLGK
jgi:hypothetical protein